MAEKVPHVERLHCNSCGSLTNHRRVSNHSRSENDAEDSGIWWRRDCELFVCLGCEEVTMRQKEMSSEWDRPTVAYFPPRIARQVPRWLTRVKDKEITSLLHEVYTALQADCARLAMMGCRTILDRMMVAAVGDVGTFEQKLDQMVVEQLLAKPHRDVLHAAIDAGSASAHRGYLPPWPVLDHVVSIVEHLVQASLLPHAAKEIKMTTPRRRRRKA